MPISTMVFLKFLGKELLNPITYLVAFLIGASINVFQGNSIFFSAVPYVVPLFVQGFAKASLRFKAKDMELLCKLPAERKDPAFVMDRQGRIVASEGNTKHFFKKYGIQKIDELFAARDAKTILTAARRHADDLSQEPPELYSEIAGKWFQVKTKAGGDNE